MRIGLVLYGSLATISGGYLYDRKVVEYMQTQGHTVQLVSLPWRNYPRHLGDNLSQAVFTQLRTLPVDVLIQDELNHPSLVWLNQRLRGQVTYPMISLVHHLRCSEDHPPLLKRCYRWVEQRYLRSVDGFIYNSQTTRKTVEALVDKPKPAVVAYPAGNHLPIPDSSWLHEEKLLTNKPEHQLRILFIGNVMARKNLHTLLAALALLPQTTWQLTVVGSLTTDVGYVAKIRQQIQAAGLTDAVHLTGSLPTPALLDQLRCHHLLAVPSYEGFGIVYLEAMSYGLPVIASTTGAAHEIVTHGHDGFLIDPTDVNALAQAIHALQQNREKLWAMSQAARARFERHPTWCSSAGQILSWLHEIHNSETLYR